MPNNYTYRFADRIPQAPAKARGERRTNGKGYQKSMSALPVFPYYPPHHPLPPWFWFLAEK